MPSYDVALPIVGYAYVTVEANSAEEAWEAACDKITVDHLEDWYPLKHVSRGNVCYHPMSDFEVVELADSSDSVERWDFKDTR